MRIALIISILSMYSCAFSQIKLTGKIVSNNNLPLEFADAILLNSDSSLVQHTYSDKDGTFSIDIHSGTYIFIVKYSNFIIYTTDITLSKPLDLGIIKTSQLDVLEEVVIVGKKKLIERKLDRIIYNVSDDVFNKGSSLMDALHRAPRLNIEQDKISIIGKVGNVKVMIDGRLQNLSDDALKAKLKGLRADQIAKVEIIPTPPARYNAEGNGGMINIMLKRDENLGLQASVNTGVGVQFEKVSTDQGLNLNYKLNKLDISLNANHNDANFTNDNRLTYDFDRTTTTIKTLPNAYYKPISFNTVIQYKPIEKITIGSTIDVGETKDGGNDPSTTEYYNKVSKQVDSLLYSINKNINKSQSKAISVFTDYTIDSLGKKISLTCNYSHNKNLSNAYNTSEIAINHLIKNTAFSNFGDNRYRINGIVLDVELPVKFGKIETGGAYTNVNNNSNVTYYNEQNILDVTRSNQFEYTEKTSAAYLSLQKEWNKKWASKLGLRMENTQIEGFLQTLSITNKNSYAKLFPTLFVSYNPNDNHALTLSYSKRLDRPSFYDLNPFRYYTNAYNYTSGNPSLLPTYTHSLELSYTLKNNLNVIVYGNYITDGISYITEVDNTNAYAIQPVNNFTQQKLGLIGSYIAKPFKWNSIYINFNGYYTNLESEKAVQTIKGLGGEFNIRSVYELNKSKISLLELSYRQILPSQAAWGDSYSKSSGAFTINFKQMFLDKNLVFNLYITDIFRQNISKTEKQYDTFLYKQNTDSHNRGIYFTISYSFGNKNVSGVYKESKNNDKNRAIK